MSDDKKIQVSVQEAAEDVAEKAGAKASDVRDKALHQAGGAASDVRAEVETTLEKGRVIVADQLGRVSSALRGSAEQLHTHDIGAVATYPEQLAERVEGVEHYLRERDAAGLRHDLERAIEREPVLTLGGLALFGAAAVWFFKRRGEPGTQPLPREPFERSNP